jgi:hypothetical protein
MSKGNIRNIQTGLGGRPFGSGTNGKEIALWLLPPGATGTTGCYGLLGDTCGEHLTIHRTYTLPNIRTHIPIHTHIIILRRIMRPLRWDRHRHIMSIQGYLKNMGGMGGKVSTVKGREAHFRKENKT